MNGELVRVLDLFSGIGGFSLGLERAGMRTVAFCEVDERCSQVLRKHWPDVPNLGDVRAATFSREYAEVICGSFPCQDLSRAGKQVGIGGDRSGLWSEYARIIGDVRPRFVIVENVSTLLGRGIERVLRDLAALGYDAEWECIQAAAVGYPHSRDRVWIVAYRDGQRQLQPGWGISHERRWRGDEGQAIDWILSGGGILRSHDGIPAALDRIAGCGNAVIPEIAEAIAREIISCAG